MAEQSRVFYVRINPQEVLTRLSGVVASPRQALLHPFANRQPLIGEIYNNYSFYFKTRGDKQKGPTWCNGNVGWNGTVSQINLVFSGGTFASQLLLTLGGLFSFVAILIGFLVVFTGNAPAYALVLIIAGSFVFMALMGGLAWVMKIVAQSRKDRMNGILDQIFRDVTITN